MFGVGMSLGYTEFEDASTTPSSDGGLGFSVGGTLKQPYEFAVTAQGPTYGNPTGGPQFTYEGMKVLYELGQAFQPWQALLDRSTLAVNAGVSLGPGQKEPEIKVSPSADLHIPDWVWLVGGLGLAGLVLVVATRRKE